jgi:ATP-binding cassette, subfamily C, bacterial CydC
MARVTGIHAALGTLLTQLGMWSVLFFTIPQIINGNLPGPMLASLTLLTLASFEAVIPLPLAAQMWNSSREAARRLFEVVDTEPEIKDDIRYSKLDEQTIEYRILESLINYPTQTTPLCDM